MLNTVSAEAKQDFGKVIQIDKEQMRNLIWTAISHC